MSKWETEKFTRHGVPPWNIPKPSEHTKKLDSLSGFYFLSFFLLVICIFIRKKAIFRQIVILFGWGKILGIATMYNTYWACCIFYVNISNGPYIIFFSSLIVRSNFWAFNFYIVYIPNWQDILMVLGLIQPSVKWIILSFVYQQNDSSLLLTTKVDFSNIW